MHHNSWLVRLGASFLVILIAAVTMVFLGSLPEPISGRYFDNWAIVEDTTSGEVDFEECDKLADNRLKCFLSVADSQINFDWAGASYTARLQEGAEYSLEIGGDRLGREFPYLRSSAHIVIANNPLGHATYGDFVLELEGISLEESGVKANCSPLPEKEFYVCRPLGRYKWDLRVVPGSYLVIRDGYYVNITADAFQMRIQVTTSEQFYLFEVFSFKPKWESDVINR